MKSEQNNYMAKIAMNKSLLKEYFLSGVRTVYLNDGDEFQINLFNLNDYNIGVDISIDDIDLSGRLILRPGERVWLERYLDKHAKFKFSTYEVEANNELVERAIRHNGEIVIKFYKEKKYESWNLPYAINHTYYNNRDPFTSEMRLTTAINSISNDNTTFCSNNISMLNLESFDATNNITTCSAKLSDNSVKGSTFETGRVEEGSYSNQNFKNTNMNFEIWPFKTETIKILPSSQKQYNANDLQKVYCTNCGRKLNSKFKFCPYCGNKCEQIN